MKVYVEYLNGEKEEIPLAKYAIKELGNGFMTKTEIMFKSDIFLNTKEKLVIEYQS